MEAKENRPDYIDNLTPKIHGILDVAGSGCEGGRDFLCLLEEIVSMLVVVRAGTAAEDQAVCRESLVVKVNLYRLVRLRRASVVAEL